MIHRTNMRTINADLPPRELVREVLASPYTRMPLWRGAPDNIIGVLHAKDLFRAVASAGGDSSRVNIEDIALEAWFVPETTTLRDQLQAFLRRKTHFALVVDEYGVVMGLVTLEDIIEEIVGDIKDEHDVAVPGIRPQPDGSVDRRGIGDDPRSQPRDGLGRCPTRRRRRSPAWSFMKRGRFPSRGRSSCSTGSGSKCCARIATGSRRCESAPLAAPIAKSPEKGQDLEGDAAIRD